MSKRNKHGDDIRFLPMNQLKKRGKGPDAIGDAIKAARGRNYKQEMVAVHFEKHRDLLIKKVVLCVQVFSKKKIGRVVQLSRDFYASDSMDNMRKMAELLGGAGAEECNERYADNLEPSYYAKAAKEAFDISVADAAKANRLTRGIVTE